MTCDLCNATVTWFKHTGCLGGIRQRNMCLCAFSFHQSIQYCLHLMLPFLSNEWTFLIYVDERGGNKKRDRQDKEADYSLQTRRKTDRRNLLGERPMNPAKVEFLLAGPLLMLLKLPFLLPFFFLLSSLSSSSSFSCHRKFSQSLADGSSAWEGGGGTCVYEYVCAQASLCRKTFLLWNQNPTLLKIVSKRGFPQ